MAFLRIMIFDNATETEGRSKGGDSQDIASGAHLLRRLNSPRPEDMPRLRKSNSFESRSI